MKKILLLTVVLLLSISGLANAETKISFVWDPPADTFQNVDGDTGGWSKNDSMVNLHASSWSLMDGHATVQAFDQFNNGILTQRGTRGLGILGGENDEIDSYNSDVEKLVITFDEAVPLYSFQVRSLYYEDDLLKNGDHRERGTASFWLNGVNVFNQQLVGVDNIETSGSLGIVDYSYVDNPYLIDKIVFSVPTNKWYTCNSDFSVASVTVPEPVSTILFVTGGTVLLTRRLYRKNRSKKA